MDSGSKSGHEYSPVKKYIADTTVLIEHLRGNPKAKSFLEEFHPAISIISRAELIQGVTNQTELKTAQNLCKNFTEIGISEKTSQLALTLLERYFLSHNLKFLDALSAATSLSENCILITANAKHFVFIPNLLTISWKEFEN